MDEAFSALDPLIRSEMQDQLIELQEKLHKTIIFITHDLDEALRIGDRIAILKDGELVQQGRPDEILLNPANDYVEAFVKDVNRARALTVETVMQPAPHRVSADTIEMALKQMRTFSGDYAFYVNDKGYQGVVTESGLQAASDQGQTTMESCTLVMSVEPVTQDAILESVIPETLESQYSVPVVDESGQLTGELTRQNLADVLGQSEKTDQAK